MRSFIVATLILLAWCEAAAQTVPAGWKTVKDAKGVCQIAVPEDWVILEDTGGSAVFHDATTAIAVVTSQPDQAFKPFPESLLKLLNIAKEQVYENSARRIHYQDKLARDRNDTSSLSSMTPGRTGSCSARVTFIAVVSMETARKISGTLGPAPE